MVADDHETHLCHPSTELTPRRRYPTRRFTSTETMARKRRFLHTIFGILVGFFSGFIFTSRGVVFHWGYSVMNSSCSMTNSWYSPNSQRLRVVPPDDDPLRIIQMTDSNETVHNSRRSLLFVGVMTAQKYLDTRAVAVYDTWGRELPGRIAFFSSSTSAPPSSHPRLPLVRLRDVDDSYPPQKKSFLMLQYMWEHYGDRFEWFLRADDDAYVRPDKLELLLRSVDSRKPQFIGQAGRGNQEEFGLLSLEYDENFCMGGPGVIMSRETLARVAPHIKYCLKNLYTTHEDVELGRCVQKFAGIPCTWSYEMQTILYHNSSGNEAFTGDLKKKEVHRAITLHPIKHHQHLYRVHNYMKALKIQALQHDAVKLHRDIASMAAMLGTTPEALTTPDGALLFPDHQGHRDYLGDTALLGMPPSLNKHRPRDEADVLEWEFISRSLFSHNNVNPRRRIEAPLREGLDDVTREVMDMINMYSKQRGRVIEYREILYGYHRLSPEYGADYILDLLLVYKKYRGRKMTVPVRRHVYLQQQFTGLEMREVVDGREVIPPALDSASSAVSADVPDHLQNTIRNALQNGLVKIGEHLPSILRPPPPITRNEINDKTIHFILPLAGRFHTFLRFISTFDTVCLQRDEDVTLTVVLFPSSLEDSFNQSVIVMQNLQTRYPDTRVSVIPVLEHFARARALQIGASQCRGPSCLLFFVDVDILFTASTLQRIRVNTIQGRQTYFPIVFSEFDPSIVYPEATAPPTHDVINDDTGYWRQFGFGIASIYKTDLAMVGGYNTSIKGWGKEDVDVFDRVVAMSKLTVFRAADPSLVHVFHIVECDPRLEATQLQMCRGTRVDTYGGVRQLADYIFEHREILDYARNRNKAPS